MAGGSSRCIEGRTLPLYGAHVAVERLTFRWPLPHVAGSPGRGVLSASLTAFRPTTSLSTLRSAINATTQDSVRGCELGVAAVAITDDWIPRAFKAQPAQIRTCRFTASGSHLG